ncbi:MAG: hypothetical protein U0230_19890 [Polyangiales bacterium]
MRPERLLVLALVVWAFATVGAYLAARSYSSLVTEPAPPPSAIAWSLAALERGGATERPPADALSYRAAGPVVVLAFVGGRVVARHEGDPSLVASVRGAIASFAANPRLAPGLSTADDGPRVRYSITVPLGEGAIVVDVPGLDLLQLVALRDGIAVRHQGRRVALVPDELVDLDLYDEGFVTPLPEIYVGVPMPRIVGTLAVRLGIPAERLLREGRFTRFAARTYSRDTYPRRRPVTQANVRRAIGEMTDYLVRSEHDGRFDYLFDARAGRPYGIAYYSLPRHAGTTYFLGQAARVLGRDDARAAAERAFGWMLRFRTVSCGAPDRLCVVEGNAGDVGATSLAVVAGTELARTVGVERLRPVLDAYGAFLLSQQRPDGEMQHDYDLANHRPVDVQYLYYSGEAALALLRLHEATSDRRYLGAARRLLEHLATKTWEFPGSRYVYNEEHWTCIALGESDGRLDLPALRDFCRRVYLWNDGLQYRRGEGPWDAEGGYGVTPFLVPRTPPVGTRGEAFVAAYGALARHGQAPEGMRAHLDRDVSMLLAWQYSPGPTRFFADPPRVRGGMPGGPIDPDVRNDFVQHAGSALVRWLELREAELSAR